MPRSSLFSWAQLQLHCKFGMGECLNGPAYNSLDGDFFIELIVNDFCVLKGWCKISCDVDVLASWSMVSKWDTFVYSCYIVCLKIKLDLGDYIALH